MRGTITLSSDSADSGGSGVASVSFQRSPAGQGTWTKIGADTTSPYNTSWVTTAVADGSYDLRVVTTDKAANSHTSSSVSVTVDNTAPDISLGTKPGDPTNQTTASFGSSSTDGTASFQCKRYRQLLELHQPEGIHEPGRRLHTTFYVEATDPAGNTSTPATYTWTVDTVALSISIDSKPGNPTNQTTATFSFSSTDGTASFQCNLDSAGYSSCSSPKTTAA